MMQPPVCTHCALPLTVCTCGSTPAGHAPPASQSRYVTRYGVQYCRICDLAAIYCKGHVPQGQSAKDGDASSLNKRIRDVRR
jgi:hypothetical protein